jgi:hypothetical protein
MANRSKVGSDESRLKQKIASQWNEKKQSNDGSFRALRKRLKRAQRKRRAEVVREAHATGKGSDKKTGTSA